jgi:hypothetical protein
VIAVIRVCICVLSPCANGKRNGSLLTNVYIGEIERLREVGLGLDGVPSQTVCLPGNKLPKVADWV